MKTQKVNLPGGRVRLVVTLEGGRVRMFEGSPLAIAKKEKELVSA